LTDLESTCDTRTYVRITLRLGAKKMCIEVEKFNSPHLGISNIVFGRRTNSNNRVQYLVDAEGCEESGHKIPEKVVLSRWKQKVNQKYRFGGMRLSPNIWRSINIALGSIYPEIFNMDIDQIDLKYKAAAQTLRTFQYPTMVGMKVVRLMKGLGLEKFKVLMERHNDPSRSDKYGTPDLFLCAIKRNSGVIAYSRFVEVKKPNEPLSKDQISELHFLNGLNLKARCFRLKEQNTR